MLAEIPGITPREVEFADVLVAAGMEVAMPSLFGTPGKRPSKPRIVAEFAKLCVR